MSAIIYSVILIAVAATAFASGVYYKKLTIAETEMFVVTKSLKLEVMDGSGFTGVIPANTVMYKFRDLPEISTYFMFVNLKYIDHLEPYPKQRKFNTVAPVSAYPAENARKRGGGNKI